MLSAISDEALPWVLGASSLAGSLAIGAFLLVARIRIRPVDRLRPARAPHRSADRSVWLDQIFGYDDRGVEPAEYFEGGAQPHTTGEGAPDRA